MTRSLAPWAPLLDRLHPAVVEGLAPLLPRLAAALPPLPREQHAGDGDPDGIDGLSRRGPYERLLASSWALAEAAPDEFVRRAAEGELAFLRRARRQPVGTWRGIVLIDTGPFVAGTPRLPLLAVVLVLARRIREAGGQPVLAWAGGPEPGLADDLDTIRAWLGTRTRQPPDPDTLRALLRRLEADPERDRLWTVGGAPWVNASPGDALAVRLALPLREAGVALQIGTRTLRLPEVGPEAVRQLLIEPAAPAPVTHDRAYDGVHLVWSADGATLFVVRGAEVVVVPSEGEASEHRLDAPIVGCGLHQGEPAFLLQQGPVLSFAFPLGPRGAWNGAPTAVPRPDALVTSPPRSLSWLPDPRRAPDPRPRAAVLLGDGKALWLLDALDGQVTAVLDAVGFPLVLPDASLVLPVRARGRRPAGLSLLGTADPSASASPSRGLAPTLSDHALVDGIDLPDDPMRLLPGGTHVGVVDVRGALYRLSLDALVAGRGQAEAVSVCPFEGRPLWLGEEGVMVLDGPRLARVGPWSVEVRHTLPARPVVHAVRPGGGVVAVLDVRGRVRRLDAQGPVGAPIPLPRGWA